MAFFIDKTAPRCSVSANCYDPLKRNSSFYTELKNSYPELQRYTNAQIKTYIKSFNTHLTDVVIENRDGLQLPLIAGYMAIATFGKRTLGIDRKTSQEIGQVVRFKNEHTEGFGGGLYYTPYKISDMGKSAKVMYRNASIWSLIANRPLNLKISKAYSTNWRKYMVLGKSRKFLEIFKIDMTTYKRKKKEINEFEF